MSIKHTIFEEIEDILRGFWLLMSLVISRSGIRILQVAPHHVSETFSEYVESADITPETA